ncbi:hypothetical protein METP2_03037 [Methanosarcinales archaeon]|nr:hypothetical protein METP2_03037 [Methanosarcinales archaeon]
MKQKLWIIYFVLVIVCCVVIVTVWATRQAITAGGARLPRPIGEAILKIVVFPSLVKQAFVKVTHPSKPMALLLAKNQIDTSGWSEKFPDPSDNGYLLLSHVTHEDKQGVVSLIRISDGKQIFKVVPDFSKIANSQKATRYFQISGKDWSMPIHPLLARNGDLIFSADGSLIRHSICEKKTLWQSDGSFHHSIEEDADGNIWVPSITSGSFPENKFLNEHLKDDAITKVSANGVVLLRQSFARILIDNDLRALVLGHFGDVFNNDPVHMNDITPALSDGKFWKKDDLLISARLSSGVFLYRPSTNKILWHKIGPWLGQHDANFIGDHQISVLGNDAVNAMPNGSEFLRQNDSNQIYLVDLQTNTISTPYKEIMERLRLRTVSQGRATILDDGSAYFEETDNRRHVRFDKERLLWSRINLFDADYLGAVSWGRYMTNDEVSKIIKAKPCLGRGL